MFDHDLANGRDDVVLVHLNHRLVQMALRLLRAEVWSPTHLRKLNRVTALLVPNDALDTPAVIAHARLMLTGSDNQRLHEEIITAGGVLREGRFARMGVGEVQRALQAAETYSDAGTSAIPNSLKQRLADLWPSHEQAVHQALDVRMRERTAGLQKQLADRAEKEISDITAILTELRTSILAELRKLEGPIQLELFNQTEQEQWKRDRDSLSERAEQIPGEIEQETEAIRSRFADPRPRLFPVAMTYLVPEKIAREMERGGSR